MPSEAKARDTPPQTTHHPGEAEEEEEEAGEVPGEAGEAMT